MLFRSLADHNRLKAALERRVFFDVLSKLVERRRADALEFAPRECRLDDVARVDCTFRRARADLAEGCPEHFDWELLIFIWNFEKITRPRIEAARLALCPDVPAIRLRSNREIATFVVSQHKMCQSGETDAPKVVTG